MADYVSPHWEHLGIGMQLRVLYQNRVKGTVIVREQFPDGREFLVTLKITNVEPIEKEQE